MRRLLPLLIAVLALTTPSALAATSQPVGLPKGMPPVTAVYIAKGVADSCGPGCDRWIVVEGRLDTGAAARLRKFYGARKTANLPLYLHSPGGDVRQGIAMGRLLRERKATARVGRTVVKECGVDGQADVACLKLKQSGRELEAELTEAGAICNSSCAYMLLGAVAREVAPNVTVGVHTARVTMNYRGGREPSKAVRDQATSRLAERLERELSGYIGEMGIDRGLHELIKTVKYEQLHVLKRDELVRFGIDKRERVETNWDFVDNKSTPAILKIFVVPKASDAKTFRHLALRFGCASGPYLIFSFGSNIRNEPLASAEMRFGADLRFPMLAEFPSARVEYDKIDKLKAATELSWLEVGRVADATGAEPPVRETVLSSAGLSQSIEKLARACSLIR
jgi:hypothetical protein